ncbi:MAG: hypothetical protein U5K37_02470 [Natrialbaceae archaeon]|nr:hypothetical protein [Natrialbaceae archaeon]
MPTRPVFGMRSETVRQAFRARADPEDSISTDQAEAAFRARFTLDEIVLGLIEDRREELEDAPDDLLTRLLEAEDEETGEQMDDQQVRDETHRAFLLRRSRDGGGNPHLDVVLPRPAYPSNARGGTRGSGRRRCRSGW